MFCVGIRYLSCWRYPYGQNIGRLGFHCAGPEEITLGSGSSSIAQCPKIIASRAAAWATDRAGPSRGGEPRGNAASAVKLNLWQVCLARTRRTSMRELVATETR